MPILEPVGYLIGNHSYVMADLGENMIDPILIFSTLRGVNQSYCPCMIDHVIDTEGPNS